MLADTTETRTDPEQRCLRCVYPSEDRQTRRRGNELAELRAGELEKRGRLRGAAETLQGGEHGQPFGLWRSAQVELNLDRDGVARSGGGEIGRQKQTEHRDTFLAAADDARFFASPGLGE